MSIRETFNRIRPPKLDNATYKVYCRFGSKQAYDRFQRERAKPKKIEVLRKTSGSDLSSNLDEPITPIKPPAMTRNNRQAELRIDDQQYFQCLKCSKNLLDAEVQSGICEECKCMQKCIESGNFQKFILFIYDFKTMKVPSYTYASKLKRGSSIQSILSFTLDKAGDSNLRKHQKAVSPPLHQSNDQSRNLKFSSKRMSSVNSIKFGSFSKKLNENSIQKESLSGGYFCNECKEQPIQTRRFHCIECSDFDLCERCYFRVGHKHEVKIFKDSKDAILNKVKEHNLKQSQIIKRTLPLLTSSIQQFQNLPKLSATHRLKLKSLQ